MTPEDRLRRMIDAARESGTGGDGWHEFAPRAHRALFVRRAAVAAGAAALVAVGAFSTVVLTSDGDNPAPIQPAETPNESTEPTPTTSPDPTPTPAPSEEPGPAAVTPFPAEIWLVQDEGRLSWGWTTVPLSEEPGPVSATLPAGSAEQRLAAVMEALLEAPSAPDFEAEATTAIPDGTRLLGVSIEGTRATVDLSREFESGGGSLSMQLRVAQVIYQATQVEGVDSMRIAIAGRLVGSIGGEGVMVDHPMDRTEFPDLAPPIVMITPKINSTLSGEVLVTGHADVFEANVSIRIIGANDKVLKETFTTATCGTGCRGDFSKRIRFSVDEQQEGRVEVLSYSAEDGSPQDVISVPVTLTP